MAKPTIPMLVGDLWSRTFDDYFDGNGCSHLPPLLHNKVTLLSLDCPVGLECRKLIQATARFLKAHHIDHPNVVESILNGVRGQLDVLYFG